MSAVAAVVVEEETILPDNNQSLFHRNHSQLTQALLLLNASHSEQTNNSNSSGSNYSIERGGWMVVQRIELILTVHSPEPNFTASQQELSVRNFGERHRRRGRESEKVAVIVIGCLILAAIIAVVSASVYHNRRSIHRPTSSLLLLPSHEPHPRRFPELPSPSASTRLRYPSSHVTSLRHPAHSTPYSTPPYSTPRGDDFCHLDDASTASTQTFHSSVSSDYTFPTPDIHTRIKMNALTAQIRRNDPLQDD